MCNACLWEEGECTCHVLTIEQVKTMHGQPVWCHIPSDNPVWGIVDTANECVMLGRDYMLTFKYYGEWKAFEQKKIMNTD